MNTVHLFNPEHDIALAANLAHFTAPHAGRQLRADLGWLPALWADEDDYVLVDHAAAAYKTYERLRRRLGRHQTQFVERKHLPQLDIRQVSPWGWDVAMATDLKRWGVKTDLLPEQTQLDQWRQLSHRRTSAQLLPLLRTVGTVGEAVECTILEQVETCMARWHRIVVKSPWSSSGRGVRFFDGDKLKAEGGCAEMKWIQNVISQQGSVMVEPFYDKVKDFGMEFEVGSDGVIRYLGLSLFHTKNSAYVGNMLATEERKRQEMARYVELSLLDEVRQHIVEQAPVTGYVGPFGIDMMVVKGTEITTHGEKCFLLHPFVELNLRRTMGHVALSLSPTDDDVRKVMRITLEEHYKLHINKL